MFSWRNPWSTPVIMHLLDFWLWFQLSTHFCLVLVCFTLGRCFLLSTTRGLSCAWELSHCWPPIRWVLLPRSSLPRCLSGGGGEWGVCVERQMCKYECCLEFLYTQNSLKKKNLILCPSPIDDPLYFKSTTNWKEKNSFSHYILWPQGVKFYFLLWSMYFKSVGFYLAVKTV